MCFSQFCVSGRCVSDSRAPFARDGCVFGDFRAKLSTFEQLSCAEAVRKFSNVCDTHEFLCCESCHGLNDDVTTIQPPDVTTEVERYLWSHYTCIHEVVQFQVSPRSCEDKAPYCGTMDRADCYYDSYRLETCCKRCRDELSGITGQSRQRERALKGNYIHGIYLQIVHLATKSVGVKNILTVATASRWIEPNITWTNAVRRVTGLQISLERRIRVGTEQSSAVTYFPVIVIMRRIAQPAASVAKKSGAKLQVRCTRAPFEFSAWTCSRCGGAIHLCMHNNIAYSRQLSCENITHRKVDSLACTIEWWF